MRRSTFVYLAAALAPAAGGCSDRPEVGPWDDGAGGAGAAGSFTFAPTPPRSMGSGSGGAPGASGDLADLDGPNCGFLRFVLEQTAVEMVVVLDRSTSMSSRWPDVTSVLPEIVQNAGAVVMWGLKTFPSDEGKCSVPDGVDVPVAAHTGEAVASAITALAPSSISGSPMQPAIRKATAYLKSRGGNVPRYLLVVSDGEPNCYKGMPGGDDAAGTVDAIREAADQGIHTFVVALGYSPTERPSAVLNYMAEAGLEPRIGMPGTPKYFGASNRKQLLEVLGSITGRVTDCVFPLEKVPPAPDFVYVRINGVAVPRDPSRKNGWEYGMGLRSIQVHGPACESLKQHSGTAQRVGIVFGCPVEVIK